MEHHPAMAAASAATPPPWLDVVAQAATTVLIASKLGGEVGKQLPGAPVSVIQGEIGQVKARTRSAAA
jgi:hypothetical protein